MIDYNTFGIDLENISDWKFLMYYFNLRYAFPDKNIFVYKTCHGFHIVVEGVKTDLRLREIFGDDLWRIKFEEARSEALKRDPMDILFSKKIVIKGGKIVQNFERYIINPLSLRFKNSRVVSKNV